MIDIHNHILPGVDDGSSSFKESIEMIKKEIEDGVTHIVLTPHVYSRDQKKDRDFHVNQYNLLVDQTKDLDINLFLGAEIYYRSHLDLDFDKYTFGDSKIILIEFNPSVENPIEEVVYNLTVKGYQVIVAHVERYQYLKKEDYQRIRNAGALLQVNASAIIGIDKYSKKSIIKYLIKNKLIDIVATDAHGIKKRPPNLKEAYNKLSKVYDKDLLNSIFNRSKF